MADLSPRQRELARHALGLGEGRAQSYRNRFVAAADTPDHREWCALVERGHAKQAADPWSGSTRTAFWLTRSGAEAVLNKGERLCREDFPPVPGGR